MDIQRDANTDGYIDTVLAGEEDVWVGDFHFLPSTVLFTLDPIAYSQIQARLEADDEEGSECTCGNDETLPDYMHWTGCPLFGEDDD